MDKSNMGDVPFCLTNTIDHYTRSGHKYYHNIQQNNNRINMRPRLFQRFDVNDAEFVPMDQNKKTDFRNHYNRFRKTKQQIDPKRLYQWRRTGFSQFNTFLLYSLSMILIAASVGHMKRIVQSIRDDRSLTHKDRVMFRINFSFSFVLAVLLLCLITMSLFELYRNSDIIPPLARNNFQYKNLSWIQDGNMFHLRTIVLVFVGCSMLLALAETINLFLMRRDRPAILVLFVPIFVCLSLLAYLYPFAQRRRNGIVVV